MSEDIRPLTLRAKTPTDLLAMVPCMLGFHPERSLVLITLGAERDAFHARVDLPDRLEDIDAAVGQIIDVAERTRIGRSVLVVYSDDAELAEAAAALVEDGLEEVGVELVEAIRTDGSRWYSLSGCTGPCCPADGTPYDISGHPFLAQAVLQGRVMLSSREELAASLVGDDDEAVAAVERSAGTAGERMVAAGRHLGQPAPDGARRHLVQEGHWVEQRIGRFLADRLRLSDEEVGRLLVALVSIQVRDVAWASMTHDNAGAQVDLWRDVVRRSPHALLAPPAALLGFAAWLNGNGALAWCAVDRAHHADPDYSLAGLLAQALAAGVPPSTWEPLERGMLPLFAG
ncbi:MAG TPA: DUF4192 domain-containing protein [Nocardioidaceae bacterium]|jgi:hypothetical protein|nr:DUF4192 domain-containing protein [Nocardioidaceae bacterium]